MEETKIAYGRLILTPESNNYLKDLCRRIGLEKISDEFHTTVLYSRENVDHLLSINDIDVSDVEADIIGFDLFGEEKNCLVLILDSSEIKPIWDRFIEEGASWNYDEFKAHITLSYDYDKENLPSLALLQDNTKLSFSEYLSEESTDEFDPKENASKSIEESKRSRARKFIESFK